MEWLTPLFLDVGSLLSKQWLCEHKDRGATEDCENRKQQGGWQAGRQVGGTHSVDTVGSMRPCDSHNDQLIPEISRWILWATAEHG